MSKKRSAAVLLLFSLMLILSLKNASAGCCVDNVNQICKNWDKDTCEGAGNTYREEACTQLDICDIGCCCKTSESLSNKNIETRDVCINVYRQENNEVTFASKLGSVNWGGGKEVSYYRTQSVNVNECALECGDYSVCSDTVCGAAVEGESCLCGVNVATSGNYCCGAKSFAGDEESCNFQCSQAVSTKFIEGYVKDSEGAAIEGAAVTAEGKTTQSDAQGRYKIDGVSGANFASAEKEGYNSNETSYDVSSGSKSNVNIFLSLRTQDEEPPEVVSAVCSPSCAVGSVQSCYCGANIASGTSSSPKFCCADAENAQGKKGAVFVTQDACRQACPDSCSIGEAIPSSGCMCMNPEGEKQLYNNGFCCEGGWSENECGMPSFIKFEMCPLDKAITAACTCDGDERTTGFCCADGSWKNSNTNLLCKEIPAGKGVIRGTVSTKVGSYYYGVSGVNLESAGSKTKTDRNAWYILTVPAGDANVKISKFGYAAKNVKVNVLNGKVTYAYLTIEKKSTVTVSGVIRDAKTKKGIKGARLSFYGDVDPPVYATGNDGTFAITLPVDEEYYYRADANGYSKEEGKFVVMRSSMPDQVIELSSDLCSSPKPALEITGSNITFDMNSQSIKVTWDSKCAPEKYVVSRCEMNGAEQCADFLKIPGSEITNGNTTFLDKTFESDKGYCYKVDAIYTSPKHERAVTLNSIIKNSKDAPCIRMPPRECATGLQKFCRDNVIYDCAELKKTNYEMKGKACNNDQVCVPSGKSASCFSASICEECNYNPWPFGIFSSDLLNPPKVLKNALKGVSADTTCAKVPACYLDASDTSIDKYKTCPIKLESGEDDPAPASVCYIYKSERACNENKCGGSPPTPICKWNYVDKGIGLGVCAPVKEDEQACELCNDDEFTKNPDKMGMSKVFGGCDSQAKCGAFGSTCRYAKLGDTTYACVGKQGMSCTFYGDQKSCGTNPAKVNVIWNKNEKVSGTNIVNPRSNDALSIGVCKWAGNKCIKDADGNNVFDNIAYEGNDEDMQRLTTDNLPPYTSAIPLLGYNGRMNEMIPINTRTFIPVDGIELRVFDKNSNYVDEGTFVSCVKQPGAAASLTPAYPKDALKINDQRETLVVSNDCIKDWSNPDGLYSMRYYSLDESNNLEPVHEETFEIDSQLKINARVKKKLADDAVDLEVFIGADEKMSCEAGLREMDDKDADYSEAPDLGETQPNDILKNEFETNWTKLYTHGRDLNADGNYHYYAYVYKCEDAFGNTAPADGTWGMIKIRYTSDPSIQNPLPNYPVKQGPVKISVETIDDGKCRWRDSTNGLSAADLSAEYDSLSAHEMSSFEPDSDGNPSEEGFYYHSADVSFDMAGQAHRQITFEVFCKMKETALIKKEIVTFPADQRGPVAQAKNKGGTDFDFNKYYGPKSRDKIYFTCNDTLPACGEASSMSVSKNCGFGSKKLKMCFTDSESCEPSEEIVKEDPKRVYDFEKTETICAKCSDGREVDGVMETYNEGPAVCREVKVDLNPPTITIIKPAFNYSRIDAIEYNALFSDDVALEEMVVEVDNQEFEKKTKDNLLENQINYRNTIPLNIKGKFPRPTKIEMTVSDQAGNSQKSTTFVTYDATPLEINPVQLKDIDDSLIPGDEISYGQMFKIHAKVKDDSEYSADPVLVNVSLKGVSAPANYNMLLQPAGKSGDFFNFESVVIPKANEYGIFDLRPGIYYANVSVIDEAGNLASKQKKFKIVLRKELVQSNITIAVSPRYTKNLTQTTLTAETNKSVRCVIEYGSESGKKTVQMQAQDCIVANTNACPAAPVPQAKSYCDLKTEYTGGNGEPHCYSYYEDCHSPGYTCSYQQAITFAAGETKTFYTDYDGKDFAMTLESADAENSYAVVSAPGEDGQEQIFKGKSVEYVMEHEIGQDLMTITLSNIITEIDETGGAITQAEFIFSMDTGHECPKDDTLLLKAPVFTSPPAEWCAGGEIADGGMDENGFDLPPKCEIGVKYCLFSVAGAGTTHTAYLTDLVDGDNEYVIECRDEITKEAAIADGILTGDTIVPSYSIISTAGYSKQADIGDTPIKYLISKYFNTKSKIASTLNFWLISKEHETQIRAESSDRVFCRYTANESRKDDYYAMEKKFSNPLSYGTLYESFSEYEQLEDLSTYDFYVMCADEAGNLGATKSIRLATEFTPTVKVIDMWPKKAAPITRHIVDDEKSGTKEVWGIALRIKTADKAICRVVDEAPKDTYKIDTVLQEYNEQSKSSKDKTMVYVTEPKMLNEGGRQIVNITCEDASKSELYPANVSFNFIVDSIPPRIKLTPDFKTDEAFQTKSSELPITVNVDEPAQVEIFINNQLFQNKSAPAGDFNTELLLVEGYNNIKIRATDEAGNSNEVKFLVLFENKGPKVKRMIPDAGVFNKLTTILAAIEKREVEISSSIVTITDSDGTVLEQGKDYEVEQVEDKVTIYHGSKAELTAFPDGEYMVKVKPVDVLGNEGEVGWSRIVVDSRAPVIKVTVPVDESYFGSSKVPLAAEATAVGEQSISQLIYVVNGEAREIALNGMGVRKYSDQSYAVDINMTDIPEGISKISFGALSDAGNLAMSQNYLVVVDLEGPLSVIEIEGTVKGTAKSKYDIPITEENKTAADKLLQGDVGIYKYDSSYIMDIKSYKTLDVSRYGIVSGLKSEYKGDVIAYVYQYSLEIDARNAAKGMKTKYKASMEILPEQAQKVMVSNGTAELAVFWTSGKNLIVIQNAKPKAAKEKQLMMRMAEIYVVKYPSDIESSNKKEIYYFTGEAAEARETQFPLPTYITNKQEEIASRMIAGKKLPKAIFPGTEAEETSEQETGEIQETTSIEQ